MDDYKRGLYMEARRLIEDYVTIGVCDALYSGGSMVILKILLVFACIVACGVLLVGITKD